MLRIFPLLLLFLCSPVGRAAAAADYEKQIQPFLAKYCLECHGGEKVKGKVDFTKIGLSENLNASFETWATAAEMLEFEEMPPEDEMQPTEAERAIFFKWYQERFVDSIEPHPGFFEPRRLSANEYRNTLRSLFGFDLEVTFIEAEQTIMEKSMVMKLLPTDPPGRSGFTNDTHGNPLSAEAWDQYSFLTGTAIEELFSPRRRDQLEAYTGPVDETGLSVAQAEKLVRRFVPRALRRPVPESEIAEILARLNESEDRIATLKEEMKIVLMSPGFIYRGLLVEGAPGEQLPADDFELAERLSYFICGTMPDNELAELAAAGTLHEPEVYSAQIDRLLASPEARNLAENFAVEWLTLNEIEHVSNNPPQMLALKSQPLDFMHYLFTEDRPLIELIDSRTAFVNPLTARFYDGVKKQMKPYVKPKGIEIEAVPNQRVVLEDAKVRGGGILTIPGVVAMNKGPVIRGTWILERILGDHLPDPPMDVGVVAPNRKGEKLSFRERFEQHRSNETCAVCHDRIDPLGFALQRYDAGGGYIRGKTAAAAENKKKKKRKKGDPPPSNEPIDTSGQLPTGETFDDFEGLKEILVTSQRETIIRNIVRQTLAYALCRKLEIHDQPTVEAMVRKLGANDGSFRDLVHEVANSLPFREICFSKDTH